jgi:hypothetical protein
VALRLLLVQAECRLVDYVRNYGTNSERRFDELGVEAILV